MLGAWRAYMDAWERDACVRVGRSRGWRAAWETDAVRARVGGERDAGGKDVRVRAGHWQVTDLLAK